jgi:hypothetical protein
MTVTSDEQFGKVVFLGINNQKSKAVKVSMDKNNPATINEDSKMVDAWPRVVWTKKKTNFIVFQKPLRSSKDVLLRINTSSSASDSVINGSWRISDGDPEIIFTANGRRKLTRFCDDVIKLKPGDSVVCNLEGDNKEYELINEFGKLRMYDEEGGLLQSPEVNGNLKTVHEVQQTENVAA